LLNIRERARGVENVQQRSGVYVDDCEKNNEKITLINKND